MYTHYITIALRNLQRAPLTAITNVLTLALGLACFVAVFAITQYWNNSESHFANADRTYVVTANLALRDGSVSTGTIPTTNELYERHLRTAFPDFDAIAKANLWSREASLTVDGREEKVAAVAVDPDFLRIFNLPFVRGSEETALKNPSTVLLSESAAMRLFGTTDVLGRVVTLGGNLIDAQVSGVIGPIPEPSHLGHSSFAALPFDLIAPYDLYQRLSMAVNSPNGAIQGNGNPDNNEQGQIVQRPQAPGLETTPPPPRRENWLSGYCCITYIMLKEDSTLSNDGLNDRLSGFIEQRLPPEVAKMANVQVGAVPIRRLTITALNAQLLGNSSGLVSITTLLFIIASLVLAVACVNYTNLATARALRRTREIGMRKVLGAGRSHITIQHFFEAGLLTFAALVTAVTAVYFLAPVLQRAIGLDLRLGLFHGTSSWIFLALLFTGLTVAGSSYPVLLLARVRAIEVIRMSRKWHGPRSIITILIGAQFTIASLLVIVVIVMYAQNAELRQRGVGAIQDPYLVINNVQRTTGVSNEALMLELARVPQIKGLSQMAAAPWSDNAGLTLLTREPDEATEPRAAFRNVVGYDFFSTLDIPIIAGRIFDREHSDLADLGRTPNPLLSHNIVIDRDYAIQLGFNNPEEAVDQDVYEMSPTGVGRPVHIIGVVENHPLYLRGRGASANSYTLGASAGLQRVVVRLSAGDVAAGLSAIESTWKGLGAEVPLQRRFMDEMFDESYRTFSQISTIFVLLAVFAIVISVFGLFGMAMQVVSRRIHEIGVRKSLGAQTWQIVVMLLYSFSKPVVIANIVAWPVAFYAIQAYLSLFVMRISLTPLPFIISMLLVLMIAWAVVIGQTLTAARSKPAMVLRSE